MPYKAKEISPADIESSGLLMQQTFQNSPVLCAKSTYGILARDSIMLGGLICLVLVSRPGDRTVCMLDMGALERGKI